MNNNDLMGMLMGALSDPNTKDKLSGLLSSLPLSEKKTETDEVPDFNPPPQTDNNLPSNRNSLDFLNGETIAAIKNMLDNFNRTDDRRIVLLNSIKPYMKSGRERNIDMAVKFIQLVNFASGLKNK